MNKIGTWSDFVNPRFTQLKPGDEHPLGTITTPTPGQPPDTKPPHVATGVMQNRQDFARSFRPLQGDLFDNPKPTPNVLDQMTNDIQNFNIQSDYKTNAFQNSSKFQNNSQMSQLRQMAAPNGPMTQNHAGLVKTWDNIEAKNGVAPQIRSGLGYEQPSAVSGSPDPVSQIVQVERENTKNAQGVKNAHDQEQINMDYERNSMQKGIHAQQQADMIKSQQQTQSNLENAYGAAGSIFGPVGAIIGNLIGNSQANKSDPYMKTAYSNQGKVNPQDTGIVNTSSSMGATGETQQVNNF